ncbi:MAG: hypothetical protein JO143_00255 [Acetobacteraceae bacterium]|jgi:uncharacterized protein YraI|nr:hypothetical protein [Acetobacteraceae bacterium]
MSSTTAKTFRLGLAVPIACLGLALGSAGSVYAQQAHDGTGCARGTSYQAQKTQGLPPSVQDRAQRTDQDQLGTSTFPAQRTQGLPPSEYQAQKTQGLPPSVQDRAQKAQGLPPSVQDRAQKADQDQLGTSTFQAQKTQGLPPAAQDRAQRASADVNGPCG